MDIAEIDVRGKDRLVLCSDGLHGVVAPERFTAIMQADGSLGDMCRILIDAANEAGGPDNITVEIVQIDVE